MLYIDASRYNSTEKRTGVENYSFFLINELARQRPNDITLISPRGVLLDVREIVIPFPRLWTHLRLSWLIITHGEIDNLFVPSHVMPIIHPKRSVITIHDVAFRHLPESYGWFSRVYLDWTTKFAVKRVAAIIVPSKATKDDLTRLYGADGEKIHVIPLGLSTPKKEGEPEKTLKKYKLTEGKYFLYVGRIERKKDTGTLIRAFAEFAKDHPDHKLVLAGFPGRGGDEIIREIPEGIRDRVTLTGYIGETEKNHLLSAATCFVFPSLYEGFGLPLLEAMHHKLPIIASGIPASKEVTEGHALFFQTGNAQELSVRMREVLDEKKREGLIAHYGPILAAHTWEASSNSTLSVLEGSAPDCLPPC